MNHLSLPLLHTVARLWRLGVIRVAALCTLTLGAIASAQLPSGWTDADIGGPGMTGSATYSAGNYNVSGGGSDIWNSADQFNFAYQTTTNDVIVARVTAVSNTDPWAKAGVMFRDSADPSSVFANVIITPGNGVNFQWRNAYAGQCGYSQVGSVFAPIWVKLVRQNNVFYAYYGSDGVNWSPIGASQTMVMSSPQLAGLCVTAHNNAALNTSSFSSVSLSYVAPAPPPPPALFGVYRQLWTGINGGLDTLTNTSLNPNWPNNPNSAYTTTYTNFEADANTGINDYGQRMRAFVIPPTNGNYTFWIASDDNSQLFLSTDETEANKVSIASVPGWTNLREWSKYPEQQSALVFMEAGRRYYLEAIMQQGTGGDNLSVRWELPDFTFEEPLASWSARGTRMIPCTGVAAMPGVYQQTTNLTVVEGNNAYMYVLATNQSAVTYQWRLNGANIPGGAAQKPFYAITNVSISGNNGQVYTCGVSNSLGGILSGAITLNVVRDTTPPTVLRAINVSTTAVQIVYSKVVEAASATNIANYVFTNGLHITAASLAADNVTVTLTTATLVYGSNYTALISNVRDRASIPNVIALNTPATFTALPFSPQDIGNPGVASVVTFVTNGLNVTAGGADAGGSSDQCSLNYQPRTGDFDIAARIASLGLSDVWAKAGLMARETLDPGSRFASSMTTPSMAGTFFEWRDPAYSQASTAGDFPPNPNVWLRLKRDGNVFTGYAGYDGQNWVQLGTATISMASQLYVGLVVSSHNATQTTVAQFRDLTDVTIGNVVSVINPREPLGLSSRRTPIVISEIMYKPAPRADTNNLEYVELYNSNPYFEDISGFQITGGSINYTFPQGTVLPGGGIVVIAASPSSMTAVYGISNVMGPYTGSLKKTGSIQLLDEQGAVLLTVPYSNVYPWPMGADGTGHSIVLGHPTYGEGDGRAWDVSDVVGGSPGQLESYHPSTLRNVMINEFLAHTDPPQVDWVELYNHGNAAVDISGCVLSNDPVTNKFVIPPGTTIPARGFVYFTETAMGFRLNKTGETIYFKSADLTRVIDAIKFEPQENGVSMGRWPDGADSWYRLTANTPATNNSSIRLNSVVINELMYDPISGNDDDQYIELYNRASTNVNLGQWQLNQAVNFTFPSNTIIAPGGYLVVARNAAHLRTNYPNLNLINCIGDFSGKLSHSGERLTLEIPDYGPVTNGTQVTTILQMYIPVNEVTYSSGGRWGQWAHGGGSSLELTDPNSNNRQAMNWADSDETSKSVWTNLEYTGVLDWGANYTNGFIDRVQIGLLDVGECLVDNIEVRPGGPGGANIVSGGDFESGLGTWIMQGDHIRSSLETSAGLGGYSSSQSLHLRSDDGFWTLGDYAQGYLSNTGMTAGQTATLRFKARWLRGWPEAIMRLSGNWLEVSGRMPVPSNLGTPGMPNSRLVAKAGPAIYEVKHSPALPADSQAVVVTARFHDASSFTPVLMYRVDTGWNPTPTYASVTMIDNGTGGDTIAGDGLYSATIPGQPAGTVVAFLVQATNTLGAGTTFPADRHDNSGVPRECVFAFGDTIPVASFAHHHLFITANWATLWAQNGGVAHEFFDGTWVDGGGRIVYNWSGRYAGSPYHQYTGSPVTTIGGMHWTMPDDDQVFGTTSLNKQHVPGNGPLDDNTLQREQTAYYMAHKIGLPRQTRRYYVFYVNGNRHGPLMEDTQVPGQDMLDEYWPNDNNGWLFKNHSWFEGDFTQSANGSMNFNNNSWCTLGSYRTTVNGTNAYKLARYRWNWWIRQFPTSASDYSQVFALIDAANIPTSNPAYYANMEAQVDTEEWLRLSAMEHATGDWDSFFTQNQWNMYTYKPTQGKWTALKWDWNITLGSGTQTWPPDGSQLFNVGSSDSVMGTFQTYTPYFRAYLRALQDVANLAMNNTVADPLLDSRYQAFVANGLTSSGAYGLMVQEPGAAGLKSWIGTMHNSILTAIANQGAASVPFAVTSTTVSNDMAIVTGTAPLAVKYIWFNGVPYPITWTSITAWRVAVPLQQGANQFSIVGADIHNLPVAGATATTSATYSFPLASPVGQVVINELMFNPSVSGAEYVELYNNNTTNTYDLSGWQFKGLSYTFPAGSLIYPTNYLILTASPAAFAEVYGGSIPVFDTYGGSLQNNGEMLSLIKPGTNAVPDLVVSRVRYSNAAPWPAGATDTGGSLQLVDPKQDNWRAGNWAVISTNTLATPQWVFVTTNISITSSTLYIYLGSAGDVYVDDVKLVGGAGTNVLANGNFESALGATWSLTANFSNSALSTVVRHGGNSSLHVVASAAGIGSGNAIFQNITPALVNGQNYTLSFWYLQNTNGGPLTLRLSNGTAYSAIVDPTPPPIFTVAGQATPGAANSVRGTLAAFPPLWINEMEPENITGPMNSAGQHTPWLELYNPTTNSVSLNGVYLANSYASLLQWDFPSAAVINPGEFKVIFADGQTNLSTLTELHTSFVLPPGSGSLALSRLTTNGVAQVLDYLDYTNLQADYSYGSFPDAQSFFRQQFLNVTAGRTNDGLVLPSFIAYASPGQVYSQNFDALPNPGTGSVNSANPVTIGGITYSLPDPFDFALAPVAVGTNGGLGLSSLNGWYGWGSAASKFGATDGDQTTGGVISFGANGSTQRAVGLLATSSTGATAFGARFINQSGQSLTSMSLQFTGELWRQSDTAKILTFYYYIDPYGTNGFPTTATAFVPALNVSFAPNSFDSGGVAVDGTLPYNQTNLSAANLNLNWPAGAALWLVWEMTNTTSKAQGIAIDNLSLSASSGNTPPILSPIGNQTVYANTLLTFTATATDADQPPQTLTFSLGAGAPAGVGITSGGVFSWTPTTAQAPSTNNISVIVTDSGTPQMSATNTFQVIVYRPNTAPVLSAIPNQTVYANTLLTFAASATDTDQPPQTLTFSLGGGAPTGANITSGGVFSWTPTAAQAPSTNNISVLVADNGQPQMSATNTFQVIVYRPNSAPVLTAIPNQTVYANTLLTFASSATDTDQPPQTLTFSLGVGAPAGANITSGGVFSWTPTAGQSPSTNNLSVIVTDNGVPAMSATNTFQVIVYRPNTAPVLSPVTNQTVYANTLLTFTASAIDTDQPLQTLTFSLGTGAPAGASITSGGVFTWTPTPAQAPSTNNISVIVRDSGQPQMSATNTFQVIVDRPNTAPVLSAIANQTVYANTLLTFTASATDTDQPPQTLTFSLGTGTPAGASITSGGVFSWTPTAAQSPATNNISVIVRDSGQPQMSATNTFQVIVYRPNTAPVLSAIANQTVYANTLLTFTASATDTDQPPQTLTFSLGTGAPAGASITSGGVFTWTPTAAQSPATNNLSVIVTDSGVPAMSATNTFQVIVYQPNTAPVLSAIANQTIYANTLLTFTASATDTDQPPQTLTFSLGTGAPAGASITSGGVFTWTPTAAQSPATNNLSVIVTDSGVPAMSATNTFQVIVYRPNTAPVLSAIANQTVYANTLLTFTASATDTDQPPQTLTFNLGTSAPAGANITSGGVFSWTPTAAQSPATNNISVVVRDSGQPQMSATNTFQVIVYQPNTAPVLSAIANQTIYANTLLTFTASATDTDQPPQTLTFSLGTGAPAGASITSGGVFTWTPTAAQSASTNNLSVIVTDNGVPAMSATNTFQVIVYRPNTAPVLSAIANQTVYANTLLTFTASATDTDQPPQTLTFSLGTGAPAGASITSGGLFTWTPTAAQSPSTNNLSVIVTDNGVPAMSATNTFQVIVYRPNTAPVLSAIANQTVYANTLLTFTASATDTDQPPQTLTFSLGTGAPAGASITSGGLFTWTPTAAQSPTTNSFSVIVTDNGAPAMSATNTFQVIVYRPNTAPAISAVSNQTVVVSNLLNFTVSATDTDQPPQTLSFSLGAGAPGGAAISSGGVFTWTPIAAQSPSTNNISVVVRDSGVPQMSATNSFTVFVVNASTIVLQSAVLLDGSYTDDAAAVIDTAQKTITTSLSGGTRFYRLRSSNALTIQTIRVEGGQVTITYN